MRVLGLQRPLFVALLLAAALYCLVRGGGWLRLVLALPAGEEGGVDGVNGLGEGEWEEGGGGGGGLPGGGGCFPGGGAGGGWGGNPEWGGVDPEWGAGVVVVVKAGEG